MVSESTRVDLLNSPLTFSHLRLAAYVPNETLRTKILAEAEDNNLSVQAMQRRIKELSNGHHSSTARKPSPAPLYKPSRRSAASPVQEFIHSVKSRGGAVSFIGGMSEHEQMNFRDELATCRDELDRFVDELTDHFDERASADY